MSIVGESAGLGAVILLGVGGFFLYKYMNPKTEDQSTEEVWKSTEYQDLMARLQFLVERGESNPGGLQWQPVEGLSNVFGTVLGVIGHNPATETYVTPGTGFERLNCTLADSQKCGIGEEFNWNTCNCDVRWFW